MKVPSHPVSPLSAAIEMQADHRILTDAAGHGHTEAVRLMLDLGFPPGARSGQDDGATALHHPRCGRSAGPHHLARRAAGSGSLTAGRGSGG